MVCVSFHTCCFALVTFFRWCVVCVLLFFGSYVEYIYIFLFIAWFIRASSWAEFHDRRDLDVHEWLHVACGACMSNFDDSFA